MKRIKPYSRLKEVESSFLCRLANADQFHVLTVYNRPSIRCLKTSIRGKHHYISLLLLSRLNTNKGMTSTEFIFGIWKLSPLTSWGHLYTIYTKYTIYYIFYIISETSFRGQKWPLMASTSN